MRNIVLLIVLALLVPSGLSAQRKKHESEPQTPEAERSATNAHSFMELFTKLERDWMEAVQKKDRNVLEETLAPEFIVRTSLDPEHPVLRAEWIQNALTNHEVRSYRLHDMAIRAFLGVAIVSFVNSERAVVDGRERNLDSFVVDVWETNHGKWQPAARYVAPVGRR